jgi:hypothetical protein
LRSAACATAGNDRVSTSAMPEAYDTITPFAYRGDNVTCWHQAASMSPEREPHSTITWPLDAGLRR